MWDFIYVAAAVVANVKKSQAKIILFFLNEDILKEKNEKSNLTAQNVTIIKAFHQVKTEDLARSGFST